MFMEGIERFSQKMAEGYDYEDEAKRDKCFAYSKTDNQQRAGDKFDKRNGSTCSPERPDRKKSVGKGKEVFARMVERPQLKDLIHAGHEEDKPQHFPREEDCPASVGWVAYMSLHRGSLLAKTLSLPSNIEKTVALS